MFNSSSIIALAGSGRVLGEEADKEAKNFD